MRFALALLAGLVAAACTSTPGRTEYIFTEKAVLPFDQAIGLTSIEIAERLGFKPSTRNFVTEAAWRNGMIVETRRLRAIVGEQSCPKESYPTIRWREGSPVGSITQNEPAMAPDEWMFQDGRYVWFGPDNRRPGVDGRPPAFFVSVCVEIRSTDGSVAPANYLALPLVLPYAAVVGTAQQMGKSRPGGLVDYDINVTLSALALGAPPPGGLDAWLANLPPTVTVMTQEAGAAVVSINKTMPSSRADDITVSVYTRNAKMSGDVVVTFEKGVITKLERGSRVDNRHLCEFTPARTFQCVEQPAGRQPFINLIT